MTSRSGAILGGLAALAGHALAVVAGFIAGRVARPAPGGGFQDLAAVVVTFVVVELVVALLCLVGGVVMAVRGRRGLGYGLVAGWVLGAAAVWLLLRGPA